jgi:hypothetical protein
MYQVREAEDGQLVVGFAQIAQALFEDDDF